MKKIIIILVIALMLTACGIPEINTESHDNTSASRFVEIERTEKYIVVFDDETGVMYAVSNSAYNVGTFTLLVDADGKPLIYDEHKR